MKDIEYEAYGIYEAEVEAAWDEYESIRKEYQAKIDSATEVRRAKVLSAKHRLDKALGK